MTIERLGYQLARAHATEREKRGASHFLWFEPVLRFAQVPCWRAAIGIRVVQHGSIRGRFRKTRERRAGRSSDGHSGAAPPPARSCRGLHSHLRGQRGPNAMRPLPEAWIASWIQRRGKRLQAHLRQPIQNGGMPMVQSGRHRSARHKILPRKHPLARLPRMKGLSRRNRVTKENGMHPLGSEFLLLAALASVGSLHDVIHQAGNSGFAAVFIPELAPNEAKVSKLVLDP